MILIRILIWFIVFYSLFKLLIRVVLPLLIKNTLQSKIKNMQQNMGEFENNDRNTATEPQSFTTRKEPTKATNGDYIDFEEVK